MLKKAGIVVATAAAGLLAVSPLAFAGDFEGDDNGDDSSHEDSADVNCEQDNSATHEGDDGDGSLISVSGNSIQVPIQACGNDILSGVVGILAKDLENNSSP